MSDDIIFHKDKVRPCPICGKGWCSSLADGTLAFCRRVPSDKTTKTGAYIHILRADTNAPRPPPLPPPPPSVAARLFSASAYMARLDNVRERYDLDGLAVELGVDVTALEHLGARYDVFSKAFAVWTPCRMMTPRPSLTALSTGGSTTSPATGSRRS